MNCENFGKTLKQLKLFYCSFDIFASHGRWNSPVVKSLIPNAFSVTILRSPIETFESLFGYTGLSQKLKMNVNEFAAALKNNSEVIIKLFIIVMCFIQCRS